MSPLRSFQVGLVAAATIIGASCATDSTSTAEPPPGAPVVLDGEATPPAAAETVEAPAPTAPAPSQPASSPPVPAPTEPEPTPSAPSSTPTTPTPQAPAPTTPVHDPGDAAPTTSVPADPVAPGVVETLGDEAATVLVAVEDDRTLGPIDRGEPAVLAQSDPDDRRIERICAAVSTAPLVQGSQTAGGMDASGDGTDDDLIFMFFNGQWRIRLTTTDGTVSEVTLPDAGLAGAQTLGAIEIGNGGGDEFLAVVQTGTDVSVVGLFGVDENGCLFRYIYESGYGVVLPIRDTWELREGLICPGSMLFAVRAEHQGAGIFKISATQLIESAPGVADWATAEISEFRDDEFAPIGLVCENFYIRDDIDAYS